MYLRIAGRSVTKSTPRCDHGRLVWAAGEVYQLEDGEGLFEGGTLFTTLDEPSHLPSHVRPPVTALLVARGSHWPQGDSVPNEECAERMS